MEQVLGRVERGGFAASSAISGNTLTHTGTQIQAHTHFTAKAFCFQNKVFLPSCPPKIKSNIVKDTNFFNYS